jgi:beta-glucosidase
MSWIASQSEVCLVFVGGFLVEGWDRDSLRLDHEGEEMIKTVEKSCAGQVVVVMHVGGQVIIEDWVDLPKIGGVVFAGYPGQETGNAIVDILWGDINPSGKVRWPFFERVDLIKQLPFTMGKAESDWPTNNIVRDMVRRLCACIPDDSPRKASSQDRHSAKV